MFAKFYGTLKVAKDATLTTTTNGKKVLTIPCEATDKRGDKDVKYAYEIAYFNATMAEKMAPYLKAGTLIAVDGYVGQSSWIDKDTSKRRYAYEFIATTISYVAEPNDKTKGIPIRFTGNMRLTKNAETSFTSNSKQVTKMSAAANKGSGEKREVAYYDLVDFNDKRGTALLKYLVSGSLFDFSGVVRQDSWKDTNGNERKKYQFVISDIEFVGSNNSDKKEKGGTEEKPVDITPADIPPIPADDIETIPF